MTDTEQPDPGGTSGRSRVGSDWTGSTNDMFFDGMIDELYIFDRELSAEQVYMMYEAGAAGEPLKRISKNETVIGDNWTAMVTGYNGTEGTSLLSNNVLIREDLGEPDITIISPLAQNYNYNSIDFNISGNINLDACWFSLNNWASNISMYEFSSTYFNYKLNFGLHYL